MKPFVLILCCLTILQSWGLPLNNLKKTISLEKLNPKNTKIIKVLKEEDSVQFVALLNQGTVVNEEGILTQEGYILENTQISLGDQHLLMKEKRDLNNENPLFFKGKLAVIVSAGSENSYHWLLQVLPRLVILSKSRVGYDRIYINNVTEKWQRESLNVVLAHLKIPKEKVLIINGDCVIQADVLIVPSVPFIPLKKSVLPQWIKKELRTIFLRPNKEKPRFERIYISRSKATMRKISNEKELVEQLKKLDFKIIELEALSPYAQARLFYNARVIVGPHGSGFANLIFVRPNCKLVEIDHGLLLDQRSFYKDMARLMCSRYYPFFVNQTTEDHLDDDMNVDVPKFIDFLKKTMSLKNASLCADKPLDS